MSFRGVGVFESNISPASGDGTQTGGGNYIRFFSDSGDVTQFESDWIRLMGGGGI